jgi:hypothetical protein
MALPVTHLNEQTREAYTALSTPHRHNLGTVLVIDRQGRLTRRDIRDLIRVSR